MFEDDLDIDFDEVLNCAESTSLILKRQNSEGFIEQTNKKPKNSNLEFLPSDKSLSITLNHDSSSNNALFSPGFIKASKELKKTFPIKQIITTRPALLNNQKQIKSSLPDLHNYESTSSSLSLNSNSTNIEVTRSSQVYRQSFVTHSSEKILRKNNQSFDPNITKRRFPGPAGLLPERCSEGVKVEELDKTTCSVTKEEICSQSSCLVFDEGPWQKMRIEFLPKSPDEIYLPDKYNIQWIKNRAMMRKLINQKAPFLAAFVHCISSHSIQNPIVNLILKDRTGTIQGTILHNLYEQYSNELVVGSVIVLKEMGVLNTGSKSEPYLTITSNNLISIYTTIRKSGSTGDTSNKIYPKIIVRNISASEIFSNIEELRRIHRIEMENLKNVQKKLLQSAETVKPLNICDNFKKAVYNVTNKQQKNQWQPNLNNLIKNPSSSINLNHTNHKSNFFVQDKSKFTDKNTVIKTPDIISSDTENINDIMDLFNTQEGLDEFFNEEPNFCSTQISQTNEAKQSFTVYSDEGDKMRCNKTNFNMSVLKNTDKENQIVLENMLEGLDTDALFDDF